MEHLLSPRLGALLVLEEDASFAERLKRVLEAGGRAIGKLGELELVGYEDVAIDASADLSMWEEMAPIVGGTIADVNALLAEVDGQFPVGELVVDPRLNTIEEAVQGSAVDLRQMVTEFGMSVRDPSVVSDRWNLIAELQSFRFKFRDRIGSMMFAIAQGLGDCRRVEVDPAYEEQLASTLIVRQTTADLRRLMRARIHKVSEVPPEEVATQAQQMEKELNAFGRTAAWKALRAQDKKTILEFRANLVATTERGPSKMEVLELLEPFVEFVDTFEQVNQRDLLVQHDLEAQAAIGVVLEGAMNAMTPEDSFAALSEAVSLGQSIYGRSSELDAYLRRIRKATIMPDAVKGEVEQFLGLLANLSMY